MSPVLISLLVLGYIAMAFLSWRIPFLNKPYGDMIAMVAHNSWQGVAMFWAMTILWPISHLLYLLWLGVLTLTKR